MPSLVWRCPMSWIETLPSGRYRAVYRAPDGTKHSQSFDRNTDAKTFLAAALTDIARGEWRDPRGGAVPFREWADKWFAARVVRLTTNAADVGRYRTHLLPAFGDAELKDLTPLRIKTFVAQMSTTRRPATVRHAHALLSTILNDAVAEGLLLTNPCRFSRLPRAARYEAVYLSPAEVERLVDAIDPAYRDLVITAAGTGLRWDELAGLKRQRVDLLRRRLEVAETLIDVNGELSFGEPKTAGSRRYVSLPKPVIDALSRRLAESHSDLVFTSPEGAPLRRRNFWARTWRPAVVAAGLDPMPRFHDLRHTHAAMLISAGLPMKAIQERLGHSSIVMTMDRYGHLLADVDDALLAVLDQRLPV
jgi:integrase